MAQRAAGFAAEAAVGLAHVVAAGGQALLQLVTFLPRQHAFVSRPRLHERLPAAQPVREMADGERVGLGRVVFHDDAKILQHQESWTLRTRRHQQIRAILRPREWLAAGAPDAQSLPFLHRHDARAIGEQEIEAFRHYDLVAPGLAGDPTILLEIVRGGGRHIAHRVDDVATAVAVEIHGVALERRRHELGWTERARPRTLEMFRRHIAARENFQCREKFLAENSPAGARYRQASPSNGRPSARRSAFHNWIPRPRWRR